MAMKIMKTVTAITTLCATWHTTALWGVASEGGSGDPNALNPLTFNPDLAIFTGIVFLLLLVVLTLFAWKPLMAGLDQREKSIADMIDEAKRGSEEAGRKLQEYEQKLADAAAEAQVIVDKARRDAHTAGEKLIADAHAASERQRQRALADIETAKNAAVQEIADQSTQLAFTLARKLIHKELRPEDHAALIRESLEKFPSEN